MNLLAVFLACTVLVSWMKRSYFGQDGVQNKKRQRYVPLTIGLLDFGDVVPMHMPLGSVAAYGSISKTTHTLMIKTLKFYYPTIDSTLRGIPILASSTKYLRSFERQKEQ